MNDKPQTLDRDWLSRKQAADYLQITPQTVSKLIRDGKLVAARFGDSQNARVRISASSIEKMLEGRRK